MDFLNSFVFVAAATYSSQFTLESQPNQKQPPGFRALFTNDRTHIAKAMILFVNSRGELVDDRRRPFTRKELVETIKTDYGAKRNTFRLIFTEPKETRAEILRELLELFEMNAPPDFETTLHIQIRK